MLEVGQMLEEGAKSVFKFKAEQEEVAVHNQVRKIKLEEEKAKELLRRLQLLEMRPSAGLREPVTRRVSSSPLRRAGQAISVGE